MEIILSHFRQLRWLFAPSNTLLIQKGTWHINTNVNITRDKIQIQGINSAYGTHCTKAGDTEPCQQHRRLIKVQYDQMLTTIDILTTNRQKRSSGIIGGLFNILFGKSSTESDIESLRAKESQLEITAASISQSMKTLQIHKEVEERNYRELEKKNMELSLNVALEKEQVNELLLESIQAAENEYYRRAAETLAVMNAKYKKLRDDPLNYNSFNEAYSAALQQLGGMDIWVNASYLYGMKQRFDTKLKIDKGMVSIIV